MANLYDGVYIPNIDGKDIFLSNIHNKGQQEEGKKKVGYTLKCRIGEQQGKWNFNRFGSKLDYSLDLIKMQEIYQFYPMGKIILTALSMLPLNITSKNLIVSIMTHT